MADQCVDSGQYSEQQIMAASPAELTLMLYTGAIGFIDESICAAAEGNFAKSRNANLKVQNILREFMATLDLQYEVSRNLMSLYEYMEHRLQTADATETKKDINKLEEVRTLLTELRDTWNQAMLIK